MPGLGENGLAPWKDVVRPHPDIVSGSYGQAEYAADLHQVAHGESSEEYGDPAGFFKRTYLTEGLKTLLTMTARRLSGDPNAQAVITATDAPVAPPAKGAGPKAEEMIVTTSPGSWVMWRATMTTAMTT